MSFRRKDTRSEDTAWRTWLSRNAEFIARSGLPDIVLRDEDHWLDFLEHGYLDHHDDPSEFRLSQLTIRQKSALLRLLLARPSLLTTIVGPRIIADVAQAVESRYSPDE